MCVQSALLLNFYYQFKSYLEKHFSAPDEFQLQRIYIKFVTFINLKQHIVEAIKSKRRIEYIFWLKECSKFSLEIVMFSYNSSYY